MQPGQRPAQVVQARRLGDQLALDVLGEPTVGGHPHHRGQPRQVLGRVGVEQGRHRVDPVLHPAQLPVDDRQEPVDEVRAHRLLAEHGRQVATQADPGELHPGLGQARRGRAGADQAQAEPQVPARPAAHQGVPVGVGHRGADLPGRPGGLRGRRHLRGSQRDLGGQGVHPHRAPVRDLAAQADPVPHAGVELAVQRPDEHRPGAQQRHGTRSRGGHRGAVHAEPPVPRGLAGRAQVQRALAADRERQRDHPVGQVLAGAGERPRGAPLRVDQPRPRGTAAHEQPPVGQDRHRGGVAHPLGAAQVPARPAEVVQRAGGRVGHVHPEPRVHRQSHGLPGHRRTPHPGDHALGHQHHLDALVAGVGDQEVPGRHSQSLRAGQLADRAARAPEARDVVEAARARVEPAHPGPGPVQQPGGALGVDGHRAGQAHAAQRARRLVQPAQRSGVRRQRQGRRAGGRSRVRRAHGREDRPPEPSAEQQRERIVRRPAQLGDGGSHRAPATG